MACFQPPGQQETDIFTAASITNVLAQIELPIVPSDGMAIFAIFIPQFLKHYKPVSLANLPVCNLAPSAEISYYDPGMIWRRQWINKALGAQAKEPVFFFVRMEAQM
jgi:hypothetical protein